MSMWVAKFKFCICLMVKECKKNFIFTTRTFLKIIQSVVVFYVMTCVWEALQATQHYANIDMASLTTYSLISTLITSILPQNYVSYSYEDDLVSGEISLKILRPVSFETTLIVSGIALSISSFITRAIPVMIIALLMKRVELQVTPMALVAFLFFFFLGYMFFLLIDFIIGTLCFWIVRASNVQHLLEALFTAFSGSLVPLFLLPDWFSRLGRFLPFTLVYENNINILTGFTAPHEYPRLVLLYAVWIAGLWLCLFFLRRAANKKMFVQGG